MRLEPALDARRLVRRIIVDDEVQVEAAGSSLIDQLEKAQKFAMPVTRHASSDDAAVQHVQSREQRRGAVTLIVMGHRAGAALLHRQAGLGTVESLDLAFFIDAQDQRFVRGMEIEPDDVLDFGGEVFVARDLERLNEMWLQPMRSPDPLDATQGGAGGCAAMLRPLQWVALGGFACRVKCATRLINSGDSGFTRDGRVASFKSPSTPSAV